MKKTKYLFWIGVLILITATVVLLNSKYQHVQEKILFRSKHLPLTTQEIDHAYQKAKDSENLYVIEAINSAKKYRQFLLQDIIFLNNLAKDKYQNMAEEQKNKLKQSIAQDSLNLKALFEYIDIEKYKYSREIYNYKQVPIQLYGSLINVFVDEVNNNFDKYIHMLVNFNDSTLNKFGIWLENNDDLSTKLYLPALLYLHTKIISIYNNGPFYKDSEIRKRYNGDLVKNSATFHVINFVPYNKMVISRNISTNSDFWKHFIVSNDENISIIYPHNGYVFGGTHGDPLFYSNKKLKFLLPQDCSTWIQVLLKSPKPFSTYNVFGLQNYINKSGLVNTSMIDSYLIIQKALKNADFNIIEIKEKDSLKVGDILFVRKFSDKNCITKHVGVSGHTDVVVDILDDKKNMIFLSDTREYDSSLKDLVSTDKVAGLLFQKANIEKYLNDFSHEYKYIALRRKNFNTIIVHNQGEYNCNLEFKGKKYRCSYGLNGFTYNKVEGDLKTPIGSFSLGDIYYRQNRLLGKEDIIALNRKKIKMFPIEENFGWGGETNNYNQYIEFDTDDRDFKNAVKNNLNNVGSNERLWRNDGLYDIVIPISYNSSNLLNKGSAIFFHIAHKGYSPTAGCIAVNSKDMKDIIAKIDNNTRIEIIA